MSLSIKVYFLYVTLLLFVTLLYEVKSEYVHFENSGTSNVFGKKIITSFGMGEGGKVSVDYKLKSNYTMDAYNSYILVIVVSEQQRKGWYESMGSKDFLSYQCELPSLHRAQIYGEGRHDFFIPVNSPANRYSTFLLQCRSPYQNAEIEFDVKVSMTNPVPMSSSDFTHLPIQQVFITRVFTAEVIIYIFFFLAMATQLFFSYRWFRKIHYLFMVCCIAQIVTLGSQLQEYTSYNETGIDDPTESMFFSVSRHLTDVIVYTTILLLSLGFSLTRDQLSIRELRLGSGVIFLYIVIGLFAATCVDNVACPSLYLMTYVVRTIVLLGIIVGMNFTVTQLRATILQTPWTASMPLQYLRARQYSQFRIAFIIFLLGPTAILLVQSAIYTWEEDWLPYTLSEILIILMFFHVGINFSPIHESKVVRAFDGTYNAIHID